MREIDKLLLFDIAVEMVKIFENNRKLIVTTILCIIYWCEVDAAANSTRDAVQNSNVLQVQSRRGQRRRRTTTEDKSYHPRKRPIINSYQINKEKNIPRREFNQNEPKSESSHDEHSEKWSIEETSTSESEESLETTKIIQIYKLDNNPISSSSHDESEPEIRRHHHREHKHKQKDKNDEDEMNWLLDTIHQKVKESSEKYQIHRSKSKHKKDTTATIMPFTTNTALEKKHNVSEQFSNQKHKRKMKTSEDPAGIWGPQLRQNDPGKLIRNIKLNDKFSNEKDDKVLRSVNYENKNEYDAIKHNLNVARSQTEKTYGDRRGQRELLISSEEYDAKNTKNKKTKINPNKIKFLRSGEYENDENFLKRADVEKKNLHFESKTYREDKKKHKHRNIEEERKNEIMKHEKEIIKHKKMERDNIVKHHVDKIHKDKTRYNRSANYKVTTRDVRDDADKEIKMVKLRPKLQEHIDINTDRYPGKLETVTISTHKSDNQKINDIRTGVLSREEPSSESEDIETTTKKVKLRMKTDYSNKNILRSTKMPYAYELQEDNPEELQEEPQQDARGPEQSQHKKKEEPNIDDEYLNPYAMEKQMKHFANSLIKERIANVTVEVVGRTVEYNNIVLIKMTELPKETYFRAKDSTNIYTDEKPEKKIIFIVHGLSVAGMHHIIYHSSTLNSLLKMYAAFVDKFDIYVIPMANPDGYAKTFSTDYWNKNNSPQSACPGVMLDRNFDVAWNHSVQMSSCSPLYPGPLPFSETETRAVRDVFHKYSHKLMAYIHLHASSYEDHIFKGDAILYPRGFSDAQTDDDKYIDLKGEVEEAMKNASFQIISVSVDTLYNWYGHVTGSSVDYASTVYGIPYAMEFLMQFYSGLEDLALSHIWGRLIPVVFRSIWKNLNSNPGDI